MWCLTEKKRALFDFGSAAHLEGLCRAGLDLSQSIVLDRRLCMKVETHLFVRRVLNLFWLLLCVIFKVHLRSLKA